MKKIKYLYLLVLFISLFAISCKDNYDQDETFIQGSDFRIINAAVNLTETPFIIYNNDNLLSNSLLYNGDTKYYRVKDGSNNIKITVKNNDVETQLFSINDNLAINQNISYFLINSDTSSNLEYIKTIDDISTPEPDKFKIRLVNAVSDLSANVDILVNGEVVASNIAFKQVSNFITVNKGATVKVVYTGTSNTVLPISGTFVSKGIYTLLLSGKNSGNPSKTLITLTNTL